MDAGKNLGPGRVVFEPQEPERLSYRDFLEPARGLDEVQAEKHLPAIGESARSKRLVKQLNTEIPVTLKMELLRCVALEGLDIVEFVRQAIEERCKRSVPVPMDERPAAGDPLPPGSRPRGSARSRRRRAAG